MNVIKILPQLPLFVYQFYWFFRVPQTVFFFSILGAPPLTTRARIYTIIVGKQ